jgi:hypothetical protein
MIKGRKGSKQVIVIGYSEGRNHYPVIELKRVACSLLDYFSFS